VLGLKFLLKEGGCTVPTVIVALAGVVFVTEIVESSDLVACKFAEGIVLIWFPETVDVTLISTLH